MPDLMQYRLNQAQLMNFTQTYKPKYIFETLPCTGRTNEVAIRIDDTDFPANSIWPSHAPSARSKVKKNYLQATCIVITALTIIAALIGYCVINTDEEFVFPPQMG